MPRVQAYGGQQVERAAAPRLGTGARVGAQPIGADAAGIASQEMSREFQEEKNRIRQTMLTEAETELIRTQNDLESNAETGYQNSKGRDAFSVPETYGQAWGKAVDDISGKITDKTVAEQFRLSAERRRTSFDLGIQRHVSREKQAYETETFKGAMDAAYQDAQAHYTDPDAVIDSTRRQEQLIKDRAKATGQPYEVAEQDLAQAQSRTVADVITRHINDGNDILAKKWRGQFGDRLLPADQERVDKVLEVQSSESEAMRIVDDLDGKPLADALDEVSQIKDPTIRQKTEARLIRQRSLQEQAKNEEAKGLSDGVLRTLETEAGGWDAVKATDKARLLELNPTAYGALEKIANATEPVQTDLPTYYALQVAAAQDPQNFAKTNLLEYADKLGPSERKEMIKLQADLIRDQGKPGSESDKLTKGVLSREQAMDGALRAVGIDPGSSEKNTDRALVDQFRVTLDRQIRGQQRATGKEMTPEEVRKMADTLLIKEAMKVPGSLIGNLWNGRPALTGQAEVERYAFQNPALANQAFTVKEVPEVERVKIVQALGRKGKDINEAAILDAYNRKMVANADQ